MRRLLSQTLIIILLLLGPITFTTANIPNFQPDCETGASFSSRPTVQVAIADRSQRSTPRTCDPLPLQKIIIPPLVPTRSNLFSPSSYSRPPPHFFPSA